MIKKYIKLSEYAKNNGIHYITAYRYWNKGKLKGKTTHTGTILIEDDIMNETIPLVATYARVSSSENKNNLDSQSERLRNYANAKGYKIHKEIKEIGSGLNDDRKQLQSLIKDEKIKITFFLNNLFSKTSKIL
jgi:predicted site-specific integrase-resolvase